MNGSTLTSFPWLMLSARIALAVLIAALVVTALLGALTSQSFVLSPKGMTIRNNAAIAIGIFGALTNFFPPKPSYAVKFWRLPMPLRILMLCLSFALLGFVALTEAIFPWHTKSFGVPGQRNATVSYWNDARRSCRGFHIAEAPLSGTICQSHNFQSELPAGKKIILSGPTSTFGTIVQDVRW